MTAAFFGITRHGSRPPCLQAGDLKLSATGWPVTPTGDRLSLQGRVYGGVSPFIQIRKSSTPKSDHLVRHFLFLNQLCANIFEGPIARPWRSPGRGDRNGASPVPLGGTSDGREDRHR